MRRLQHDIQGGERPRLEHDLSHLSEPTETPPKKRTWRLRTLVVAAIASLLVHLLLVAIGFVIPRTETQLPHSTPLRAQLVSPKRNRESTVPQKQVVTIAPPKELKRPEAAKYLAEFDQTTKEETKSRVTSPFEKVTEKPSSQKQASSQTVPPSPQRQSASQSNSARPISKNGLLAKTQQAQAKSSPQLFPSWKDSQTENGKPFNDHLSDVEEDAQTRLNTWQWRHATFFVRVKEAVARRWNPNFAIRRNDPRGELVGTQDRVTQIMATIDHSGNLVAIKVTRDSGVYYLDDAAVNAFKEAAPFPNPPKALFGSNETFEFPFGFILSYDKGFKFDLDWKPY